MRENAGRLLAQLIGLTTTDEANLAKVKKEERYSPEVDDVGSDEQDTKAGRTAEPPLKKRQLPSSWKGTENGGSSSRHSSIGDENIPMKISSSRSTSSIFRPSILDKTASDLRREGRSSPKYLVKGLGAAADPKEAPFAGTNRKLGGVFLSREQTKVKDMVVNGGKNVFFTGSAGERYSDFQSNCDEVMTYTTERSLSYVIKKARESQSFCAKSSPSSDSSTTTSPMPSPSQRRRALLPVILGA